MDIFNNKISCIAVFKYVFLISLTTFIEKKKGQCPEHWNTNIHVKETY